MLYDTIAAISSPYGEGAIALIRISGTESIQITNRIFKGKDLSKIESHKATYGNIYNYRTNEFIDEVMVTIFKAPKSFTTEDIVEISCHGGLYVTAQILEIIIENGARMAEPGEFTKRAFINGRIDLTQAEAVMDVIEAKTASSLKVASQGLSGGVSRLVNSLKNNLIDIIGKIEVNIDYPEYDDVEVLTHEILKPRVFNLLKKMDDVIEKSQTGIVMKEGVKTAIVGRPNVGKSSILNLLLDEEKAIVTEIEGTTRDIVEGTISVKGLQLNLVDTAGIRETEDTVEQIGIKRSFKAIDEADLVILVLDFSKRLHKDDKHLLSHLKNKNHIVVINKIDQEKEINVVTNPEHVLISATDDIGVDKLKDKILKKAGVAGFHKDVTYLSNIRQATKLKEARFSLKESLVSIQQDMPVDIISIDLQNCYYLLNEILGVQSSDTLIDELFSRFCLGK